MHMTHLLTHQLLSLKLCHAAHQELLGWCWGLLWEPEQHGNERPQTKRLDITDSEHSEMEKSCMQGKQQ